MKLSNLVITTAEYLHPYPWVSYCKEHPWECLCRDSSELKLANSVITAAEYYLHSHPPNYSLHHSFPLSPHPSLYPSLHSFIVNMPSKSSFESDNWLLSLGKYDEQPLSPYSPLKSAVQPSPLVTITTNKQPSSCHQGLFRQFWPDHSGWWWPHLLSFCFLLLKWKVHDTFFFSDPLTISPFQCTWPSHCSTSVHHQTFPSLSLHWLPPIAFDTYFLLLAYTCCLPLCIYYLTPKSLNAIPGAHHTSNWPSSTLWTLQ